MRIELPKVQRPFYEPFIARHFPAWHANREAARMRSFEASYKQGVATRTSELWQSSNAYRFQTAGERYQLQTARDRGYGMHRNNPVARTLVQTETDNVIGDGLNFLPRTDTDWDVEAKDRYYEWLETCSVRGGDMQSGCETERMLWERGRVAGDIGWILVARGPDSLIQVVPSENLVTPDKMHGDQNVVDGIRFDAFGKPTFFYVLSQDDRGKRDFIPVQARDFVYLPHLREPNQARGESCFMQIFELLANLDQYVDSVALAAWMGTVFGLIFKQSNAATAATRLPYETNSQGEQQRAVTWENGQMKFMAPDGEVVQVDAKQPMQQTPEFIRTLMRMLGQPFDMPLSVVFKDTSQENFASARIGLIPFQRSCRIKAAKFAYRWSRTIRWWLSRERQRARDDPKRWTSAWPERYWAHDLVVNAWTYTDPVSEAQGDLLEMSMGTKSPQQVITERGRDAEQIKRDFEEWGDLATLSSLTRDPVPEPVEPAAPQPSGNGNGRIIQTQE